MILTSLMVCCNHVVILLILLQYSTLILSTLVEKQSIAISMSVRALFQDTLTFM